MQHSPVTLKPLSPIPSRACFVAHLTISSPIKMSVGPPEFLVCPSSSLSSSPSSSLFFPPPAPTVDAIYARPVQEMERVAQETMDKAVTYQNELENQKLSGQKQVPRRV